MDEYIKREAAFDAITDLAGKATTRSAYEAVWKSARALEKIPAADVAPVIHGHWIKRGGSWYCSYCDKGYRITCGSVAANNHRFCPNCGAVMDGGTDNG